MQLEVFVRLKNKEIEFFSLKKNYSEPFISFESVDGNSNLTKENLRVRLGRIFLFIEERNLFSLDKISSDDISHVVDLRN